MSDLRLRDSALRSARSSHWLKAGILELERRNPLDGAADADYLARLMRLRARAVLNGDAPAMNRQTRSNKRAQR